MIRSCRYRVHSLLPLVSLRSNSNTVQNRFMYLVIGSVLKALCATSRVLLEEDCQIVDGSILSTLRTFILMFEGDRSWPTRATNYIENTC